MNSPTRRFDWAIVLFFLIAGTLFLLRLAYMPIYISTPVGLTLLLLFRAFIQARYEIRVPYWVVLVLLGAIEVDAVGNYFGLYNRKFETVQYDEISHCLVSGLVMPVATWLLMQIVDRRGYRLPLGGIAFFAFTTVFTFAGFYEVIELWDDKYMHPAPGMRIHSPYDTANDLQWDLIGMGAGAAVSYLLLRRRW